MRWFAELSWPEFATTLRAFLARKWVCDQIERAAARRLRLWLADRLAQLAERLRAGLITE